MADTKRIRRIIRILLIITTIICMTMIFRFSSDTRVESDVLSRSALDIIIKGIYGLTGIDMYASFSSSQLLVFEVILRKCAHMFIYFVLSINCMCLLLTFDIKMMIRMLITVFFCFIYACTDEFHQMFSLGRGAHFTDCLIDTAGAMLGILAALVIYCICFTIYHKLKKRH